MRRHVVNGAELLKDSSSPVLRLAEEVARTHHERWDGTGYPAGTVGDDIPLSGRIAAVCDVFDASRNERPYKAAWSIAEACARSSESGADTSTPLSLMPSWQWCAASRRTSGLRPSTRSRREGPLDGRHLRLALHGRAGLRLLVGDDRRVGVVLVDRDPHHEGDEADAGEHEEQHGAERSGAEGEDDVSALVGVDG